MIARIAVALAVAAACVVAFVATGADDAGEGRSYKVELDNAFGLTEGGDFRVGGVRAGKTTSFGLTEELPARAVVGFEITEPGFDSLRSDAFCQVRQQSLIGEYYLNCQPGSDEEELPEGATIPVDQTGRLVPIDLVQNVLRLPYAERLRLIIAELGTGLAGRPDELSEALRRAHPGLRETSKTLRILGDQTETLKNFVTDCDTVVAALAKNKIDVGRFVRESAETAEISASRDTELAAGFERLPGFLEQLGPYMGALGKVADETTPLLGDLRTASNDLERFFDRPRALRRGDSSRAAHARRRQARSGTGRCATAGTRSSTCAQSPGRRRRLALHCASSSSPSTIAAGLSSVTRALRPPHRRARIRRARERAAASPALRRSQLRSSGRRSRSTASTRSVTS